MITVLVTQELDGDEPRTVGRAILTLRKGDYRCRIWELDKPGMGTTKEVRILQSQHHHDGVWEVLRDALNEYLKPGEEIQFDGK